MEGVAREIRLVARPMGFPGEDLFEVAETPIPDPGEGQLLVRNAYFSVDPYMRPRMNDVRSYVAPFTLGEAMTGGAVGRVEVSRNPAFAEGDWLLHALGWREWALSDGSGVREIDPAGAPLSTALGARGATGACGGAAGKMANIAACRVLGSAGSEDKLAWLRELGFDVVFNYRERSA